MQLSKHAGSACSSRSSSQQRRHTQPCRAHSTASRRCTAYSSTGTSTSCSTSSSQQHDQEQQVYTTSRRGSLAMLSLGLASCFVSAPAANAASTVNTANKALADYMALDSKGKLKEKKALDEFRAKYGIRRSIDGRVSLQSASGDWFSVRLDMEVPGAILLRREKDGAVFALETENLAQVDLSDDYIIIMMFADGAWEQDMAPIEFEEESGAGGISQLQLPERDFREFVGLLKELNEDSAEAAGQAKK